MKKLIFAFILLLFAVGIGFLIHRDPGYILVTYQSWSIETSLWIGVVAILLLFIIFYGLLRLFRHTSKLGTNLQLWNKERRERKAGVETNKAFEHLIEMQWNKAEDLFSKSAKDSTCPVINYSAAAFAAQQLNNFERRNKLLSKLSKEVVSADKTAKLVECYLFLESDHWQEALTSLKLLEKKYPNDPAVLRYLGKTYEALEDWPALADLLSPLSKVTDPDELSRLENVTYCRLIQKTIHPEQLDKIWASVPKALKIRTLIVEAYADKAMELRQDDIAISPIENALKKNWHDSLVHCYGQLRSHHLEKQIHQAESWLKKRADNPALLLCLGSLCIDEKLWGKANDYLNQALAVHKTTETYYHLGRLAEATNDPKTAIKYYREAAKQASE